MECDPLDFCNCNPNNPPVANELGSELARPQRLWFGGQCFHHDGKMYVMLAGVPTAAISTAMVRAMVAAGDTQSIKQIDDDCLNCPPTCQNNQGVQYPLYHPYQSADESRAGQTQIYAVGDLVTAPDAAGKFFVWICTKDNGHLANSLPQKPASSPGFWKKCDADNGGPRSADGENAPCPCPCNLSAAQTFALCAGGQGSAAGPNGVPPAVPPAGLFTAPWTYSPGDCVYLPGGGGGHGELFYATGYTDKMNQGPTRNPGAGIHTTRFQRCVACEEVTTTTTTTTSGTTTCCPENLDVVFVFGAAYSQGACVIDPYSDGTGWPNPRGMCEIYIADRDIPAANQWPMLSADWSLAECDGVGMDRELSGCACAQSGITGDSFITWTSTNNNFGGKPSVNCQNCGISFGVIGQAMANAVHTIGSYNALPDVGGTRRGQCIAIVTKIGSLISAPLKRARIKRFKVYQAIRDFPNGTLPQTATLPSPNAIANAWWRQMGPKNLSTALPDHGADGRECEPSEPTTTTTADPCTTSTDGHGHCDPSNYDQVGGGDCIQYDPLPIFWRHPWNIARESAWCICKDCSTDSLRQGPCPAADSANKGPFLADFKEKCSIAYGAQANPNVPDNLVKMEADRCWRNPYNKYVNGYPKGICVRYSNRLFVCIAGGLSFPTPNGGWNPAIAPITDQGRVWKECVNCKQTWPDPYPNT